MTEFDFHSLPYNIQQLESDIFYRYCRLTFESLNIRHYFIDNIASYLLSKYTEGSRHYHTIMHINYMFKAARGLNLNLSNAEMLAILYHDAIYYPGQFHNEEDSAALLEQLIDLTNMTEEINTAYKIVLETANFMEWMKNPVSPTVLDLDLAAFADTNYENFYAQNKAVEKEFQATTEQRIKFLQSILAKPKIYYVLTSLENTARNNINKYINGLTGD